MTGRPSAISSAVRALIAGIVSLLRSPGLLLVTWLVTVVTVIPFGLVLADRLRDAFSHQPPISLDSEEIDAEWWVHFRADAAGLEATFTPSIIGFAAPLDNLSALLDASPRPLVLIVPVTIYVAIWALLWGGALSRMQRRSQSVRDTFTAAFRHFPRMIVISATAVGATLLLYLTVHPLLFGVLFDAISPQLIERNAFFLRVVLYLLFGALLATISVAADYTRINVIRDQASSVRTAFSEARRFLRAYWSAVTSLYLLTGTFFVALLVIYAAADRRFGGWRAILIGQAFIVGRLAIRLLFAASEIELVRSRELANPGPPAPM